MLRTHPSGRTGSTGGTITWFKLYIIIMSNRHALCRDNDGETRVEYIAEDAGVDER